MPALLALTIVKRWYVFCFLALYLLASLGGVGWRRTLTHLVATIVPMTLIEQLGTATGFPFGVYHYVRAVNADELWIGDVILVSVLAWPFLTFAGWQMARWVLACRPVRLAWHVVLATLFLLLLDLIMDPVTARGGRWFLVEFHVWDQPGGLWGVPWENYWGWLLSLVLIYPLWQFLDRRLAPLPVVSLQWGAAADHGWASPRPGVWLYAALWAFHLIIAFAIGEWTIGLVGIFIACGMAGAISFAGHLHLIGGQVVRSRGA